MHLHARRAHVDEDLAQPVVSIRTLARAHQGDHPVVLVRAGRPHLGAVHDPPALGGHGTRHHRRQIAARVGFAHPDTERQLAPADGGEEAILLLRGPDLGDQRSALAVGDPVVTDRGAPPQQLLGDDEPIDRRPVAAAVLARQRHPDPSSRREQLRERGVLASGHPESGFEGSTRQRLGEKRAHLVLERTLAVVERREPESHQHRAQTVPGRGTLPRASSTRPSVVRVSRSVP